MSNERGHPTRWLGLPLLALLALLAGCGRPAVSTIPPTPPTPPATIWQIITTDGVARRLEVAPVAGRPTLDETAALTNARDHVPASARSAAAQARFAAITLASDQAPLNFQARPVWLVTYPNLPFVTENCACQGRPEPPTTVVALDATTGELVLVYGLDAGP